MKRPPILDLTTYHRPWVTPRLLADHLGCDRRTIIRMIELGKLAATRVGRCYRIQTDEARRQFVPRETSSNNT